MPLLLGASTTTSKHRFGGRCPKGRGDCPVILSHQNKLTERQAQSRFAARDLSARAGMGQSWHAGYRPSQLPPICAVALSRTFGGLPGSDRGGRMLAASLLSRLSRLSLPSFALDTRANAKQEGTP